MDYIGILQDDAAKAFDSGAWDMDVLVAVHEGAFRERRRCQYMPHWGFVAGDKIFYNTMTVAEVEGVWRDVVTRPVLPSATCYADGSGTTAGKPAGIGVVAYRSGRRPLLISENIGPGTNNRAELMALWRALRCFPDLSQDVWLYSDSEYALGALTQDWARNKNANLIAAIRQDLDLRHRFGRVRFEHVQGHAKVEGNEVADTLAGLGRKHVTKVTVYGDAPDVDEGFATARL